MNGRTAPSFGALLFAAAFFSASIASAALQSGPVVSTLEQVKEDFNSVPCKNSQRQSAAVALFEKMGAAPSEISVERFKGVENIVVRKPGTSDGIIVVGAHYDKVVDGCGAIDNWSGVVAVAHLLRTVNPYPLKKTVYFVGFGKEEEGLIGSRAMVGAIKKEQVANYCAMINIDSLGLGQAQVARNMSNRKLLELAAEIAAQLKLPFGHAAIETADSDSSPFLDKKIPALTIHGLTNDWPAVLHTYKDGAERVNPISVYLGYRLALSLLLRIDDLPCNAFR
ncbi:MAG TPA: M20/M25/M40 family metallo-hydrolase [Blastocatellia bacterium]|nr:M20/M25/M40 family metallo-hydrolase [Blastocatellia bacterium]